MKCTISKPKTYRQRQREILNMLKMAWREKYGRGCGVEDIGAFTTPEIGQIETNGDDSLTIHFTSGCTQTVNVEELSLPEIEALIDFMDMPRY